MNKQQIEGAIKKTAGKVQEAVGEAVGSKQQQAKGIAKQVAGRAEEAVGDMKQAVKNGKTKI